MYYSFTKLFRTFEFIGWSKKIVSCSKTTSYAFCIGVEDNFHRADADAGHYGSRGGSVAVPADFAFTTALVHFIDFKPIFGTYITLKKKCS